MLWVERKSVLFCFMEAKTELFRVGPKKEPKQLSINPVTVLVNYAWNCVAFLNIYNTLPESVELDVNDKWRIMSVT